MRYEKPEVAVLGTACMAIQGTGKHSQSHEIDREPTNPAYEADE
jgi:hypothetical protein